MYAAKSSASGMRIYHPDMDTGSPQRLALARELRQAIRNHEMIIYVQPQASLATGVVAPVRWAPRRRPLGTGATAMPLEARLDSGSFSGAANRCVSASERVVCEYTIPRQTIAAHMANGSTEYPTLRVCGEKTPTYPASAPETAQHRPAQEQIEGPLLSVFGFYNTDTSPLHVEVLPLEFDQCVSPQTAKQREQVRLAVLLSGNLLDGRPPSRQVLGLKNG
jgi:hypothetical protein